MEGFDDILDDLLGSDDDFDPKPKPTQKKKETTVTPATSGKPTKDDFYSQLAAETEDLSEVSDANQSIDVDAHKDVNDKDTKVFGNKKSTPKGKDSSKKADFDFMDDDPLADILSDSDLDIDNDKRNISTKTQNKNVNAKQPRFVIDDKTSQDNGNNKRFDTERPPTRSGEPNTPKRSNLFDDTGIEVDSLLDDTRTPGGKSSSPPSGMNNSSSFLGRTSMDAHLTSKKKGFVLDKKYSKKIEKEDSEDFMFGDYAPSSATKSTNGRGVRFDDARPTLSAPAGGRIRKASTLLDDMLQNDDDWLNTNATTQNTDWLGLNNESDEVSEHNSPKMKRSDSISNKGDKRKDDDLEGGDDEWLKSALNKRAARKSFANADCEDIFMSPVSERKKSVSNAPVFNAPITDNKRSSFDFESSKPQTTRRDTIVSKRIEPPELQHNQLQQQQQQQLPPQPLQQQQQHGFITASSNDIQLQQMQLKQQQMDLQRQQILQQEIQLKNLQMEQQQMGNTKVVQEQQVNDESLKIKSLTMEKEHLQSIIQTMKVQHEQETTLINDSFKKRVELMETTYARREQRLKEEVDAVVEMGNDRVKSFDREMEDRHSAQTREQQKWREEKSHEFQRIQKIHSDELLSLRKENKLSQERIRDQYDKEFNNLACSSEHTQLLNGVVQKMELSVHSLDALQDIVSKGHSMTLTNREKTARSQDDSLKAFQIRLESQQKSNEMERARLEGLISTLELQLNDQTRSLETERYRLRQEENRLRTAQQSLEKERELLQSHSAKERIEIEKSKDRLMEEQSRVTSELLHERETLASDRARFEIEQRLTIQKDHREDSIKKRAEFDLSGSIRALDEQRQKINDETHTLNRLKLIIEEERVELDTKQSNISDKSKKLEDGALRLSKQTNASNTLSSELEASQTIMESNKLQVRQEKDQLDIRSIKMNSDLEVLRDQQYQFMQDKMSLEVDKDEFENYKRKVTCNNCSQPCREQQFEPVRNRVIDQIESTKFYNLWNKDANKDKEYLDCETDYLSLIRQSPYHSM